MEAGSITAISNESQVRESAGTLSEKNDLKLKEACRQFEQIFLKYLVDSMWASVESMGEGFSGERAIWQDMFNNEIAGEISGNSGLGIADAIYRQISNTFITDKTGSNDGAGEMAGLEAASAAGTGENPD